jgi:hypothetical protein
MLSIPLIIARRLASLKAWKLESWKAEKRISLEAWRPGSQQALRLGGF